VKVGKSATVTPSYAIRDAEDADVEQCVSFALVAAPERTAIDWREALARDIEDAQYHLVFAESGGGIVGYGRARLFQPAPAAPPDTAPRGYYLTGVFVVPDQRRSGIGAALTQARIDWISRRATEAWFFANARNTASIELHRRLGFEEVSRRFSFPGLTFDHGEGILFRLQIDQRT
jgi:ribosomal protein S18 acetylase RimI-like enzyme